MCKHGPHADNYGELYPGWNTNPFSSLSLPLICLQFPLLGLSVATHNDAFLADCPTEIKEWIISLNYRFCFGNLSARTDWCQKHDRTLKLHDSLVFLVLWFIPVCALITHEDTHCHPQQVAHCDFSMKNVIFCQMKVPRPLMDNFALVPAVYL